MNYKKIPVVVEAFKIGIDNMPDWFFDEVVKKNIILKSKYSKLDPFEFDDSIYCEIKNPKGNATGNNGDYIIKDEKGDFYPCKPDIFELTYDKI